MGSASCRETQRLAERKRADIAARMKDLQAMRRTLNRLIKRLRAGAAGRVSDYRQLEQGKPTYHIRVRSGLEVNEPLT